MPSEIPELSVVLPCYNEAGNLAALVESFRPFAQSVRLEVILVDNGSTDDSPKRLQALLAAKGNEFVRSIRIDQNIGYGHGIQQGLTQCRAEVVGFTHADLQTPPQDVLTAFHLFTKENVKRQSLIKGRRLGNRPFLDRGVTVFYNFLAGLLLGIRIEGSSHWADVNAEPKLFSRKLIPDLLKGPTDFTFDLFVLWTAHHQGLAIVEFNTAYLARTWGKSKLAANPSVRFRTAARAFKKILTLAFQKPIRSSL